MLGPGSIPTAPWFEGRNRFVIFMVIYRLVVVVVIVVVLLLLLVYVILIIIIITVVSPFPCLDLNPALPFGS
jgi:hypothetical protein